MSVRNRRGFTLVELLVVISIIGMLMALLIPAVQQARETARGNTCRNNLTNLVKAIINYEGTTQSYPGYQQTIKSRTGIEMQVGWLVPILRQLDRPDMDNSIRSFAGPVDPSLGVLSHPFWQPYCELRRQQGDSAYPDPSFLEILLCPSDASRTKQGQVSHYVVNTGRRDSPVGLQNNLDIPLDFPDNGVFQASGRLYLDFGGPQSTITTPTGSFSGVTLNLGKNARKIGSGFISRGDGLSTTLMLSENVAAHDWTDIEERQTGFIWWPYEVPDDATNAQIADLSMIKINGKLGQEPTPHAMEYARPSSYHPGGVNVAFAGGNVRFISEEMSYLVYILLMTPNGRAAKADDGTLFDQNSYFTAAPNSRGPATALNEQDIIP